MTERDWRNGACPKSKGTRPGLDFDWSPCPPTTLQSDADTHLQLLHLGLFHYDLLGIGVAILTKVIISFILLLWPGNDLRAHVGGRWLFQPRVFFAVRWMRCTPVVDNNFGFVFWCQARGVGGMFATSSACFSAMVDNGGALQLAGG